MSTIPDTHLSMSSVVPSNVPSPDLAVSAGSQRREWEAKQSGWRCEIEPVTAIEGNHYAIQAFLQSHLHRPSVGEFGMSNLRPGYRPEHRLVIKRPIDKRMAGHLQMRYETLQFGTTTLPVALLSELAVQGDYVGLGAHTALLSMAEKIARQNGAVLLMFGSRQESTIKMAIERQSGWASWGEDLPSLVSPQRLLANLPSLDETEFLYTFRRPPQREIVMGRLTDIQVLSHLYHRVTQRAYGAMIRGEAYWTWLLGRGAHQQVFLYCEDGIALAYGVVRGASVLELIDTTDDHRGAARLLEQIAQDAIEQGRHSLRLFVPAEDWAHAWVSLADGRLFAEGEGEHWYCKALSLRELLRRLGKEIHGRFGRLQDEGLPDGIPQEPGLNLLVDAERLHLCDGKRVSKIRLVSAAKSDSKSANTLSSKLASTSNMAEVEMTRVAATQLLLGYRSAAELAAFRSLRATDEQTMRRIEQLFPVLPLWRYPWDGLPMLQR